MNRIACRIHCTSMKRNGIIALGLIFFLGSAIPGFAGEFRLGAGFRYWRLSDASDVRGIKRSGRSEYITAQYRLMPLVKGRFDLERFPSSFAGGSRSVYAPQIHLVAGGWVYGALGAGILYSDGQWADRPFTQVCAGLDVPVFPRVRLDVHLRYQVSEWGRINRAAPDFESDLWSLGLALGIRL